ncbi:hypothetical protein Pla100_18510 [Neorhodopirellula pilleata]|uniref:Uncharacterized protein n=1 Tax=Neorhodopirellula pilleata TaxID=2714738 RepID=A0A5C6ARJ8_9BACT|nr:hypothetical protein Pla100_18510 [Neorhodopirellula pilleata]
MKNSGFSVSPNLAQVKAGSQASALFIPHIFFDPHELVSRVNKVRVNIKWWRLSVAKP